MGLIYGVLHQQTLRQAASFSGVGLHSGNRVNMTFLPAPPNYGIRFRRLDLEGSPEIEARIEHVSTTNRSTSLAKGMRKFTRWSTFWPHSRAGVDNAVIELDSSEPPIADGSAREYVKMIQAAGVAPQTSRARFFYVQSPVSYEKDETTISVFSA